MCPVRKCISSICLSVPNDCFLLVHRKESVYAVQWSHLLSLRMMHRGKCTPPQQPPSNDALLMTHNSAWDWCGGKVKEKAEKSSSTGNNSICHPLKVRCRALCHASYDLMRRHTSRWFWWQFANEAPVKDVTAKGKCILYSFLNCVSQFL